MLKQPQRPTLTLTAASFTLPVLFNITIYITPGFMTKGKGNKAQLIFYTASSTVFAECSFLQFHCCIDPVYPTASFTSCAPSPRPSQRFCLCVLRVYIGLLTLGFMHERAYMLDWAEKIPEIMQPTPVSCCSQSRLRCSVLQEYKFWLSILSLVTHLPLCKCSASGPKSKSQLQG